MSVEPIEEPTEPLDEGYAYDELRPLVETTLRAGLSVLLRGHPGVGKSSLAAEVAASMGLPVHDIRLAQREPAEIGGVYFPDRDRQVLSLLPPAWVHEVCERPAFVFLDEVNAAVTRLHQAAAYQIVLEHRVGPFRFHPDTVVMAAGNLEEDRALATPLSSALANRFAHYTLRVDVDAWLRWAAEAGVHPAVQSYVAAQRHVGSGVLYEPDGADAFPTPRSWEMASRVLRHVPEPLAKRAVASCVGLPAAERFFAHFRIFRRVDPPAVIGQGRAMDFTSGPSAEPSFVYAAVYAVADWLVHADPLPESAVPNLVRFLRSPGLDPEHLFLFLRRLKARRGLLARLRALEDYRRLAGELVDLRMELYR